MNDGHEGVLRVQDERNAGRGEWLAGQVFELRGPHVRATSLREGAGRRGRETVAVHRGEVAARFLEQLAAELAHLPAAPAGPFPAGAAERRAGSLQLLESGDDAVPQLAKPLLDLGPECLHAPPAISGRSPQR